MATKKKIRSTAAEPALLERRTAPRHRVLKGGIIHFNRGYGALECVVRNLSEDGARLAFGDTTAVPNHFQLKVAGEMQSREAEVRWRLPLAVGISFL
jgi:hypothetical protein